MWSDIAKNYRVAWAFASAAPLVFAIPATFEFAQHVAEMHIGMYDSFAAARRVAADPLRLSFGLAKVLALYLPSYWFTRYIAFDCDIRAALRLDLRAIGLWSILFCLSAALAFAQVLGPQVFGLSIPSIRASIGSAGLAAGLVVLVIVSILQVYLTPLFVGLPLGRALDLRVAMRTMWGYWWRWLAYLIAGALPLTIVHYALGYGAMGRSAPLAWAMLAVDAISVGFLALTLNGANVIVALRAARARGVELV